MIERTSLGGSEIRLGFAWPHNEIIASHTRKFILLLLLTLNVNSNLLSQHDAWPCTKTQLLQARARFLLYQFTPLPSQQLRHFKVAARGSFQLSNLWVLLKGASGEEKLLLGGLRAWHHGLL